MNNVLVTGGTGFVGYWMQKTQPHNLDTCYIGRVCYAPNVWDELKWDLIVHLAPVAPTRALACARKFGSRLLYASSGIVYHPEWDTEYRQAKLAGEAECLASGVDVVIARLFTFYGEKLSPDHAVVAFEQAAQRGEPLRIWGDGNCVRSYMSGEEMARWLWAILLRGKSGEAYDVGGDTPITILNLALKISEKYKDRQFPYFNESRVIVENRRPDPMPIYLPTDTAKTRALLDVDSSL